MFDRGILVAVALLALCLLACGPTPAQVNNSGHVPYGNRDFAAALDTYRGARARAPESGEPYYNAGNVLYRMEEYQESLDEYDDSLRHAEGELRSRGFFNRGNAEFRSQRYAQAIEAYKEVLRMNPDDIDAKHNLELALLQIPPQDQGQDDPPPQDQEQDDPPPQDQGQDDPPPQDQGQDDPPPQDQGQDDPPPQDQEQDDPQQGGEQEQDEPVTEGQARQILESVGEDAQTLQERRQQVLVSPNPPSEFDW